MSRRHAPSQRVVRRVDQERIVCKKGGEMHGTIGYHRDVRAHVMASLAPLPLLTNLLLANARKTMVATPRLIRDCGGGSIARCNTYRL